MKKIKFYFGKFYFAALVMSCVVFTVNAQTSDNTATNAVSQTEQGAATQITLNKTSANLALGETLKLEATVTPSNGANKKVIWSSSNEKLATVSENGVVTPKKVAAKANSLSLGTVIITATVADGSDAKAYCKIVVLKERTQRYNLNGKSRVVVY